MTIQELNIHDFIKKTNDVIQVKQLIYQSFLSCNLPDASEALKKLITKIYAKESNINDTIDYRKTNTSILTYHDNQNIIGVLINKQNKITHLFVDSKYQHKGIGKDLMSFFEKKMKKKGYISIYLKPSVYAYSFYQKIGFIKKDDIYIEKYI